MDFSDSEQTGKNRRIEVLTKYKEVVVQVFTFGKGHDFPS